MSYVCICSALNVRQVQEAINNGAKTPEEIFSYWDTKENCGRCMGDMDYMIAEFHDAAVSVPMAPPEPPPDNE